MASGKTGPIEKPPASGAPVAAEVGEGALALELPESADDAACARLLELVTTAAPRPVEAAPVPAVIAGVVLGRLRALTDGGAVVAWAGAPSGVPVRSMAALDADAVGREVALVFEQGDPARPVLMGVVEPLPVPAPALPAGSGEAPEGLRVEVETDRRRIVLESADELVLCAGEASITLTRAGKILIRGAYVSSHATGLQRIVGGAVEIN